MAYEVVMPYHLHMPSYFLETFTEYPTVETEWINDEQAHCLYCFRIPIGDFYYLPKGRYRINKLVAPHNQHVICLSAQFEIP